MAEQLDDTVSGLARIPVNGKDSTTEEIPLSELECLRVKTLQQELQFLQLQAKTAIQAAAAALDDGIGKLLTAHSIPAEAHSLYAINIDQMCISLKR